MTTRKSDRYSAKCEHVRDDGNVCRAWAVRGSDPPRCQLHSLSKEEQVEQARKGGRHRAQQRRLEAEPKPRTGLSPTVKLETILSVCAEALTATFETTGEPDWSARLAACGTLLVVFPRYLRSTPEDVRALLERALPLSVLQQQGMRQRLHADQVYASMRAEHDRLRIRHHPVAGLYIEPYPAWMIAPWQQRKEIRPPKPEGRLERLEDGTLVLYRDGEPPLLIEEDTVEELTAEERANVRAYLADEERVGV